MRPAVMDAGFLVDVRQAMQERARSDASDAPWTSVRSLLEAGSQAMARVAEVADQALQRGDAVLDANAVRLGPPVPDARKVICLGSNYLDHAQEAGGDAPAVPILFAKFATSLSGPHDPIVLPPFSEQVDYEAELAVVVGKRCRNVVPENVDSVLAGGMAFNDVSARDVQLQTSQWTAGKAVDGFAPCGPSLVTLDELGDLQSLSVTARVNGEQRQDGNTSQMIFSVAEAVSFISMVMTLEAGDIIATGTPAGVGLYLEPSGLLRDGDTVEVEIDRIGALRNEVVAESESAYLDPCVRRWTSVQAA